MKVVRYNGSATVRQFSAEDLQRVYGVSHREGIRIDTRVSRDVSVTNTLADKLIESGEFTLMAVGEEDEDDAFQDEPEALAGTEDSDSIVARAQHVPGPETVSDGPSKTTKVRKPAR